jgi:DDE superfamily endonuclease
MDVFDCIFGDDNDLAQPVMTAMNAALVSVLREERNASHYDQRLAWDDYCKFHVSQGTFDRRLRMSKESFDKLLGYIRDSLVVNETKAKVRGGSIVPELCLYCTIRWLAGGSYLDITDICGISKSSFYHVVWKTITAVCKADELQLKFPKTNEDIGQAKRGFASKSTDAIIDNCVGVVDGYLLRIIVPPKTEVGNVKSFFSGHYQCYGMNVQAVADHQCRFTFLAVSGPGVMCDREAIGETSLKELIEGLPFGVCVIGDAAYCPTEHMVPVYAGLAKLNSKYDNFNYYASQLRIRVEMAFGIMNMKWGILGHPISCKVSNIWWLVQGIGCLHNYCINERLLKEGEYDAATDPDIPAYIPTVPHDSNGDPIELTDLMQGTSDGHSYLREFMAERVAKKGLERPTHNKGNSNKRRRGGDDLEDNAHDDINNNGVQEVGTL